MKSGFLCTALLLLSLASAPLFAGASEGNTAGNNLVRNPDFDRGVDGWKKEDPSGKMQSSIEERHGHRALKMSVAPPAG